MDAFLDVSQDSDTLIQPYEQSATAEEDEIHGHYTKGQLWGALRKAWKAYKISKAEDNHLAMMKYADRIRKLQSKLGLELSKFAEVGLA